MCSGAKPSIYVDYFSAGCYDFDGFVCERRIGNGQGRGKGIGASWWPVENGTKLILLDTFHHCHFAFVCTDIGRNIESIYVFWVQVVCLALGKCNGCNGSRTSRTHITWGERVGAVSAYSKYRRLKFRILIVFTTWRRSFVKEFQLLLVLHTLNQKAPPARRRSRRSPRDRSATTQCTTP